MQISQQTARMRIGHVSSIAIFGHLHTSSLRADQILANTTSE